MHVFITMLKDGMKHTTSNNEVKISTQLIRNETVRMKVDCQLKVKNALKVHSRPSQLTWVII